jgi:hypothetical protein
MSAYDFRGHDIDAATKGGYNKSMTTNTNTETADAEPYEASISDALTWAASAEDGEYLVEYEDTGMTAEQDPGSRCGYDDAELDQIRRALADRDLTLIADDRGLMALAAQSTERPGARQEV